MVIISYLYQGRIQDFKLGAGGALKKNCVEWREGRIFFGVFRMNNHDFTPNNHIFSNFVYNNVVLAMTMPLYDIVIANTTLLLLC